MAVVVLLLALAQAPQAHSLTGQVVDAGGGALTGASPRTTAPPPYQTAKAMRTAVDSTGATDPITLLNGTRDWYAAYSNYIITNQTAAGAFPSTVGTIAPYFNGDMASSWALLILSPSLFELPPTATCSALPNELGGSGGTANFTAAGSSHPDPGISITGYSWNFDDGSPLGSGQTASHLFLAPVSYPTTRNVTVTVTASNNQTDTASCPITIVDTNPAPTAVPGNYTMCMGTPLTLDGSGSTDQNGTIASYQWSWGSPTGNSPMIPQASGKTVNATTAFTAFGPGTWDLSLRVTDDGTPAKSHDDFGTVTVLAANDAACNQPPSISQADLTAEATGPSGAAVSFTPTVSDPNAGDTLTVSCAPPSGSTFSLGTTAVTCSVNDGKGGSDSTTFNVEVTKAQTTTVISCSDVVYNGAAQETCTATVSDTHGFSQAVTVDYAGDTTNVGTVSAAATFAEDSWHTTSDASTTYEITHAPVRAEAGSGNNVYNGGMHAPTACRLIGPYIGNLTCANNPLDAGPNVSVTPTAPNVSGPGLDNFVITPVNGSNSITPATPVPTATGGTFTYNGAPHIGTCSVAGVGTDVLSGVVSYSSGSAPVDEGVYTVTCSFAETQNYVAASATASLTIAKAALTVTTNSYTRSYLAPDPMYAGTLDGVAAGDGITVVYASAGSGSQVPGVYPIVPTLVDPNGRLTNYTVTSSGGLLTITNASPMCTVAPSTALIWPPNHRMVPVTASGATDVDGGPLTYRVVSILQDEPTNTNGDGNTAIDGAGLNTNTAQVRAERTGDPKNPGNGRVYHITFAVTDSLGLSCQSTVTVGVPHDQSGKVQPVDGGAIYDSTVAGPPPAATATKGKGNLTLPDSFSIKRRGASLPGASVFSGR